MQIPHNQTEFNQQIWPFHLRSHHDYLLTLNVMLSSSHFHVLPHTHTYTFLSSSPSAQSHVPSLPPVSLSEQKSRPHKYWAAKTSGGSLHSAGHHADTATSPKLRPSTTSTRGKTNKKPQNNTTSATQTPHCLNPTSPIISQLSLSIETPDTRKATKSVDFGAEGEGGCSRNKVAANLSSSKCSFSPFFFFFFLQKTSNQEQMHPIQFTVKHPRPTASCHHLPHRATRHCVQAVLPLATPVAAVEETGTREQHKHTCAWHHAGQPKVSSPLCPKTDPEAW